MSPKAKNKKELLLWAEVDLDALRKNLEFIRAHADASSAGVLAVVKADAYGHGMKRISLALAREGVDFFGVANMDEAIELRKVCRSQKILVLGVVHESRFGDLAAGRIIPTVSSLEDARVVDRFMKNKKSLLPVHVKIDTGMGRLGVWHEETTRLFLALKKMKNIRVDGVYTHFSSADTADRAFTERQLRIFNEKVAIVKRLGFDPKYIHAANSVGLMRFKEAHFNLVRPGIILYGIDPAPGVSPSLKIHPILSLKTRISFLKEVEKNRSISYGALYRTRSETLIATLPVGYSHGYRVGFSNNSRVLIHGQSYPVVGRVTMDQTLVDLGKNPRVRRWDTVTLIGEDHGQKITAEELAGRARTIPYEILCAIHPRIPRIYKGLKS